MVILMEVREYSNTGRCVNVIELSCNSNDVELIKSTIDDFLKEDDKSRETWTGIYRSDGLLKSHETLAKTLPTNICLRNTDTGNFMSWKSLN